MPGTLSTMHGCGGFETLAECQASGDTGLKDKSMISYTCYKMELCSGCKQYLRDVAPPPHE